MKIQGFHVNAKADHGVSGYTTLCASCAYSTYEDDILDNHSMAIFSDSESDCIQVCEYCGELLEHNLTGDCEDCQYGVVTAVSIEYRDGKPDVNFYRYQEPTRKYKGVSAYSLNRLMRYMFDRGFYNGHFHYGDMGKRYLWYTVRGWYRK